MKAVIASVSRQPRYWEQGQTYFIQGAFDDDSEWSVGCKKEDKALEMIETFKAMIGKEQEYGVEEKPDRNGRKQWKLKDWPGKPVSAFGGGGKAPYQLRYGDTQEGFVAKERDIFRSVALQQALVYVTNHKEEGAKLDPALWVTTLADHFYEWLCKDLEAPAPHPAPAPQDQKPANVDTAGPPPKPATSYKRPSCPQCGEQASVFQEKDRDSGEFIPGSFYCWNKKGGCGNKWKDIGALADQVGVKKGDQIETKVQAAERMIDEALKKKDLDLLRRIEQRLVERLDDRSMSIDEVSGLDLKIQSARKSIQTGQSHSQWHDTKVQEAQQQLALNMDQESGMPSAEETPF